MRHQEAEAERQRLQRDDHEHTYGVRERPVDGWEVVRTNIPRPTPLPRARPASPTTDAQTDELADAARRLKALRERRARLANVASGESLGPPEDPRPFIVRQIPGFG